MEAEQTLDTVSELCHGLLQGYGKPGWLEQALDIISELCYSVPGVALALIESTIREKPALAAEPALKFLKAKACGSIGFFQLIPPGVDPSPFGEDRLRNIVGITDQHLDLLEKGLWEIREIEEADPHALENVLKNYPEDQGLVDGLAMAVERCRPGRVQEILGKTKVWYFGGNRIKIASVPFAPTQEQLGSVIQQHAFFQTSSIVRSAMAFSHGTDRNGRDYVHFYLYERSFEELGPEETIGDARSVGSILLFDDGTSAPTLSKKYEEDREGKPPKEAGLGETKTEETAKEKEERVVKALRGKDLLAEALALWVIGGPGEHQEELLALTDEALDLGLWKGGQAMALYIQGRVLHEQGALEESQIRIKKALDLDPTVRERFGPGRVSLPGARPRLDLDPTEGIDLLAEALTVWKMDGPDKHEEVLALTNKVLYSGLGKGAQAAALYIQGRVLYEQGALEESQIRIKKALDLNPTVREQLDPFGILEEKKDKCFIATAAYGSAAAPDVVILRELRDLRLKQTQIGCLIIRAYERWSPALAQVIVRHPFAGRTVRRLIVAPAAWIAQRLLSSSDRREIQGGNHG